MEHSPKRNYSRSCNHETRRRSGLGVPVVSLHSRLGGTHDGVGGAENAYLERVSSLVDSLSPATPLLAQLALALAPSADQTRSGRSSCSFARDRLCSMQADPRACIHALAVCPVMRFKRHVSGLVVKWKCSPPHRVNNVDAYASCDHGCPSFFQVPPECSK